MRRCGWPWTAALADLEVTPPQFAVLTMIVAYPGVSGADLARLTFLTPQTVNVIVRNLERAAPSRNRPMPRMAVSSGCTATARGQALLKRCRARVTEVEARIAGLAGREEEKVVRALAERGGGETGAEIGGSRRRRLSVIIPVLRFSCINGGLHDHWYH